tara:strand:- start:157 stop:462 length:306 start_codon:yes stop_codon:yes gene_type:complete
MRLLLILILFIPLPAAAEEKDDCNGTTYAIRECRFKKLVQSDKELKKVMKPKTFENWVGIRQQMCEEAYDQYKKGTIYPQVVMSCSIDMNKTLLQKTRGLN